jgi:hypothetical protein
MPAQSARAASSATRPQPGTFSSGRHLEQRIQNEVALHYPGVRQREVGTGEPLRAEHQQVEIDAARTPAHARRLAAQRHLERTQRRKNAGASSCVSSAATALTKSGCAAGPSGFDP